MESSYPDLPQSNDRPKLPYFGVGAEENAGSLDDILFGPSRSDDSASLESRSASNSLIGSQSDDSDSDSETVQSSRHAPSEVSEDLDAGRQEITIEAERGRARGRGRGGRRGRGRGLGRGPTLGLGHGEETTRGRGAHRGRRGKRVRGNMAARQDPEKSIGRRTGHRMITQPPEPEFREAYDEAMNAYLEADFELALERASDAVQINPEVFSAYNLVSQIHTAMGSSSLSLDALWLGAHTARDPEAWWNNVRHTKERSDLTEEERHDRLRDCYSNIIRLKEDDKAAHRGRLEYYLQDPVSRKGSRECRFMLKLWPDDLEILGTYAEAAIECKDRKEVYDARRAFRSAVEIHKRNDPDGRTSEFDFSDLVLLLNLFKFLGKGYWQDGLNAATTNSRWLLGRADEACWKESPEDDREWDLEHEPRRAVVHNFDASRFPIELYGQGLPPDIRANLGLFRLHLGQEHFKEAMHHFEFLCPNDLSLEAPIYQYPHLFIEVGNTLFLSRRWLSALRFYEPLIQTNAAVEFITRARIARAYEEVDALSKAIEHYEILLQSNARHKQTLTVVALLCHRNGDRKKAQAYTQRVLDLPREKSSAATPNAELGQSVEQEARKLVQRAMSSQVPLSTPTPRAILPRPPPSESQNDSSHNDSRRGIKFGYKKQPFDVPAVLIHLQMQFLQNQVRAGEEKATNEWLAHAEQLLNNFASTPEMFPKDKGKSMKYKKRRNAVTGVIEVDLTEGYQISIASTPDPDYEQVDFAEPEVDRHTYEDISMRDWLDIFCEYANITAKRGEKDHSYQALSIASSASPFFSTDSYYYQIHVTWLACAISFSHGEQVSTILRWFAKVMPFESNIYRLWDLAHGACNSKDMNAYHDKTHIQFFKRQARLMDYALLDEAARQQANFTLEERAAALDPRKLTMSKNPNACKGNPYGITAPVIELLVLLGQLTASQGYYPEALSYYLRAYSHDQQSEYPEALIPLSISIAYMQWAVQKTCDDRNGCASQAQYFFHAYRHLRLLPTDSNDKTIPSQRLRNWREEVEFNEGRLFHGLGMLHLAIPSYERCLAIEDETVHEPTVNADKWIPLDSDGDLAMREDEDDDDDDDAGQGSKRDAAYALRSIYLMNGHLVNARRVTEQYLGF